MPLRPFALVAAVVVLANGLAAADTPLQSAEAKVDKLVNEQWKPGDVVVLSPAEINAWVAAKVPEEIPQGIRDTKIELGEETASASATVDFLKIQQSRGKSVGWAVTMFQGERPLKISVRVASSGGKITVFLTRVELSGVTVEGTALDLLIKAFFLPLYPDAKIGEPVDLDYKIDHVQIHPDAVRIAIKK
ncbi:MAG TPA: hypothetical protein VGG72_26225 [Bryobacteraceae bacterium]|jgi:hypothetical protein